MRDEIRFDSIMGGDPLQGALKSQSPQVGKEACGGES